jgi:hypothetical protein
MRLFTLVVSQPLPLMDILLICLTAQHQLILPEQALRQT